MDTQTHDPIVVLREVMSALNEMPCSSEDFLGEELYLKVQSVLDSKHYVGTCDLCGDLVERLLTDNFVGDDVCDRCIRERRAGE